MKVCRHAWSHVSHLISKIRDIEGGISSLNTHYHSTFMGSKRLLSPFHLTA